MRKRRSLTENEAPYSSPLERHLGRVRTPDGELVPEPKRKRRKTVSALVFGRAVAETEEMIASRNWDGCTSRHLVALFNLMHEKTYKVAPTMTPGDLHVSVIRMGKFVKDCFDGNFIAAVAYFRWVWTEEIGKEKWCRENNHKRHRALSFGLTISGTMVTAYRVDLARQSLVQGSS